MLNAMGASRHATARSLRMASLMKMVVAAKGWGCRGGSWRSGSLMRAKDDEVYLERACSGVRQGGGF